MRFPHTMLGIVPRAHPRRGGAHALHVESRLRATARQRDAGLISPKRSRQTEGLTGAGRRTSFALVPALPETPVGIRPKSGGTLPRLPAKPLPHRRTDARAVRQSSLAGQIQESEHDRIRIWLCLRSRGGHWRNPRDHLVCRHLRGSGSRLMDSDDGTQAFGELGQSEPEAVHWDTPEWREAMRERYDSEPDRQT